MSGQTKKYEFSAAASAALGDMFEAMARAYDRAQEELQKQNDGVPEGYVKNAKGWMMPASSVREKDALEDRLVDAMYLQAAAVAEACRFLKLAALSESHALVWMAVADAGGDGSSEAGKVTLQNLRATRRIVIDRRDTVSFGPEVQAAKEMVMACVRRWGQGANTNLVQLAMAAFQANANGDLSVGKVAALWRMECEDEDWQKAMQALKESLRPSGTATYLRFHERADPDGKWQLVEARV